MNTVQQPNHNSFEAPRGGHAPELLVLVGEKRLPVVENAGANLMHIAFQMDPSVEKSENAESATTSDRTRAAGNTVLESAIQKPTSAPVTVESSFESDPVSQQFAGSTVMQSSVGAPASQDAQASHYSAPADSNNMQESNLSPLEQNQSSQRNLLVVPDSDQTFLDQKPFDPDEYDQYIDGLKAAAEVADEQPHDSLTLQPQYASNEQVDGTSVRDDKHQDRGRPYLYDANSSPNTNPAYVPLQADTLQIVDPREERIERRVA